ncbi:hypothetical protein ZWY2020_051139 [Hordeum vulgare]|nr:hypothetical protein ZWY2020_051139 [Hordeum vulgare]
MRLAPPSRTRCLSAVSSPLPFSFPSARATPSRRARAAAASSATASDDFDYLADPSVAGPASASRTSPPRFPAADAALLLLTLRRLGARGGGLVTPSSGPSAVAVEPLDARAHRGRLKKLSKVALRRARDWRERVSDLTDRLLALPPGAPVAEVLDDAWASPDELATVVRAVGAASWRRALDAFEWLAASSARPRPASSPSSSGATVQVFNAMMGVYARSGRFDDVRQLLDAMRGQGIEPDLVSFNTLINASAKSGCLAPGAAFDLLHEVRQAGLRPDVITYNTLIMAVFEEMIDWCRRLWTYNAMVRVCEELVKAGFRKDGITYNAAVHMYGKMGRLDLALGLYDEMRAMSCTPDAVTYTVLIDSLGKVDRISDAGRYWRRWREAELTEQTFDRMVASGVKPDRLAYLLMALYRTMMKDGYVPDDTLYQVILAALAKRNEHEEIEELCKIWRLFVKWMHEEGLSLLQCIRGMSSSHNLISECSIMLLCKNQKIVAALQSTTVAIIEAYGRTKLWQHAEKIYVKGLNQDAGVDRRIWNALIHAYAESGLYEQARAVFDIMIKGPSLIIDGRLDELFVVVQELQDMGFKISKSTVMKIYNGMKEAGYLPNMHIYRSMISLFCRNKPDLVILNTLLLMYTESGDFDKTVEVYHSILEAGLEPGEDTYNTLIVMYSRNLRPEEGFTLLESYKSLLVASGKAKLWEQGEQLLEIISKGYRLNRSLYHVMKMYRIQQFTIQYCFGAYLKNGDYNLGITKLLEMKRDGIKPDHQVWTCFIKTLVWLTVFLKTGALERFCCSELCNALEDLLWAFERRATASYISKAGLISTFKDIYEQLEIVKKFSRLAMLSEKQGKIY